MRKLIGLLLSVLLLTSAASADIFLFSGARYDVFITDPGPVGLNPAGENLIGFTLYFVNTTTDAGFDAGSFDGMYFGYTGITAGAANPKGLHQHYSTSLEPISPTANCTYATPIDTHFVDIVADMLIINSPTEDNAVVPSVEPTDAGSPFDLFASTSFGTYLTGVFAVNAAPTYEVAYIVIPDPGGPLQVVAEPNSQVACDFFISGIKGGEIFDFHIGVPEPATMGLLTVGAVGALFRRKRA